MKRLSALMFVFLFCINLAFALEFDNVKDYDSINKEVTITNAFGLGDDIAKVKLNTDLNNYVQRSKEKIKVAEMEASSFQDYNNAFKELELFNKRKDMEKFERDFDYRVRSYETIIVNDYENICEDVFNSKNNSYSEVCENIIIGTHEEQKEKWTKLTPADFKKNDVLTIGIFTDVQKGDIVEWIPNMFGVRIDEWAVWSESIEVGMVSFWELSTDGIDYTGTNNGTLTNQAFINTSRYDGEGCMQLDGIEDYLDVGSSDSLNPDFNFSFGMFVNATSWGTQSVIFSSTISGATGYDLRYPATASDVGLVKYGVSAGTVDLPSQLVNGQEYHLGVVVTSSGILHYVNGINVVNDSNTGAISEDATTTKIGATSAGDSEDTNGCIRKAFFYNRSVTASEMADLATGLVPTASPIVIITEPTNDTFNSVKTELNYTVTTGGTLSDCWYSLNLGETNVTITCGNNVTGLSSIAGNNTWKIFANDTSGEIGEGSVQFVFNASVGTTINIPDNGANFTTNALNISWNSSASNLELKNTTSFIWNNSNSLILENFTEISGIFNTTFVNFNLSEGIYNWSVTTKGEFGAINTSDNRTFRIHLTPTTINILEPNNTIDQFTLGDNQTLRWELTEAGQNLSDHIKNCSYIYNGVETQLNLSQCIDINQTSFLYVQDVNNLTFTTTEEFGFVSTNFTSWNYLLLELNQTFNNQTTEGNQEDFRADLIVDGDIISEAIFNYNNTNYTTNIFSSGGDYIITSSILVPPVQTETNISFLFYVVIGGQTYSLTSHNQSVGNVNISVCSPGDNLLLNMSLKDEVVKSDMVGIIEINTQAISKTSGEIVASASTNFTNISSGAICLNPLESFSDLYLDAEIKYYSEGYAPELYYIQQADMSEYPKNLSLFDLNSTFSTNFIVTYQDDNLITVEEAIIQLQRKYINEGIYEIVEAPLTSNSGKVILHIDLRSNKYKATVVKDGEVLDIFDNIVFSCDNELIGECTQTLLGEIDPQNDISIITLRDFSYFLTTANNTITTTFSIPSGTPSSINVQLDQYDLLGNKSRCNQTVTSSGGSIDCSFNDSIGNSVLDLRIYKDGEEQGNQGYIVEDDANTIFSGNNFIILIVVLLSLTGMAFSNPIGIIIVSILTFVIGGALWLINGFSFVIGLGALFWILGAGIVIIFKMNKQEDR